MNAMIDVILRPNLSSAYIIQRLAHGTAKFIQSVYSIDLVTVKPFAFMMFGSQAPRPMATPKKAVKQIMPAMTRVGNIRNTTPNGSLLVLLAASVESELSGGVEMPRRLQDVERFLAAAMRRQIARRFRQRKAKHPDDQRADADNDPNAAPDILGIAGKQRGAEQQHRRGSNRPHAGAADEVDEGEDSAADCLRRVFARIGKA